MVRIGVISNPLSQRNKRGMSKVEALLAQHPNVVHCRLDRFENLGSIVAEFIKTKIEVIAINGGDGTVQAVLTELFRGGGSDAVPVIAVLSSGMTNMIAADAGLTGSAASGLKRLIAMADEDQIFRHLVKRQVLRMEWGAADGSICGMFFGAAGICRAIDACRERVHALGFQSNLAVGLTVGGLLLRWLLPGRDTENVFQGDQVSITLDGGETLERSYFLVIVTTLDRLILRSRPYWGDQPAALRFTGITFPPKNLLRSVFRVLYGGAKRNLPADSYFSRNADRIELNLTGPFTLDGEMYQPTPGHPVVLSNEGSIQLVKL